MYLQWKNSASQYVVTSVSLQLNFKNTFSIILGSGCFKALAFMGLYWEKRLRRRYANGEVICEKISTLFFLSLLMKECAL